MNIFRPGQRVYDLSGVIEFKMQLALAEAGPWWLSGGISAANCIAAYQPIGAASLAASYVNLANPGTYDAAPGVAPTFDAATGWTFNGSDQYLNSGVTLGSGSSIILRFSDKAGSLPQNAYFAGSNQVAQLILVGASANSRKNRYAHGTAVKEGIVSNSGVIALAATAGFIDAASDVTGLAGTGTTNRPIFIGCYNSGGTPALYMPCKIQAIALYNIDISSYISPLTAAMAAL